MSKRLRVLVACEFSGIVRDAFLRAGHDAWSCDLLPTEVDGPHLQLDVLDVLDCGWDLLIAFPPCTHLAVSGARWFKGKADGQAAALMFFWELLHAPIPCIGIENPISVASSWLRKPDQIFQPYEFGHPEFKRTCLWLKNLPRLRPTKVLTPPRKGTPEWRAWNKVHNATPGPDRWKIRSRTYQGVADAMAAQWAA